MEEIKILYIDDEINSLSSFKSAFRFDYKILLAASQPEALNYLVQNPDISIILCDQRMAGIAGVDFLEDIKLRFPRPVRMLAGGFSDVDAIIKGVNNGNIYKYIKKPWKAEDVKTAIGDGYKYYLTSSLLTQKNEELHSAYKQLDEFAYNVTHGLRDPILSVLSLVEIAQYMDDVPEGVKEILQMVGLAMVQLDNYVENTHDYHQLKNDTTNITDISFQSVADEFTQAYSAEQERKSVDFACKVDQQETFKSNKTLLNVIVNNLLSNAFKYQRKNITDNFVGLDIHVANDTATIVVKDNGIGIKSEYIKNIFEPLYRATSVEYGSGLGLYNLKDALQKLGGDIYVDSKEDVGSMFKIVIPNKK
jgi:two-component system sensor histidine kinase/response regulator